MKTFYLSVLICPQKNNSKIKNVFFFRKFQIRRRGSQPGHLRRRPARQGLRGLVLAEARAVGFLLTLFKILIFSLITYKLKN